MRSYRSGVLVLSVVGLLSTTQIPSALQATSAGTNSVSFRIASDDASVSPGVAPGLQTSGPAQNPGHRAVEVTGARSPVSRTFVNYETDIYVSPPAENTRTSYTSDNAVVSSTHPLTPIRPLATVSGSITVGGDPYTLTISTSGDTGQVTFSGTAGENVGLGLTNVTLGTSTCCSSFVSILNPDGTTLKSISAFGTNGADVNVPTLPTTGTYTIVIDPQLNTGSVTLILSDDVTGTITVGSASTSITIPRVGQNGRVTFSGTAGEFLGLGLSPVSIGTSGCCAAFVSVLKPDGTTLMNPAAFGNNGQNENIPVLPTTGTYTLFIDPGALTPTDTGSVTLTLSDDVTGTIAVGGSSTTMTISRVGQNGRVTFSGTGGEHLGLGLSPVTIGTSGCCAAFVSVLNPDGTTLMNPAAFGTSGQSENVPMLPTTGAYTIFLDPQGTLTGSITSALAAGAGPSQNYGCGQGGIYGLRLARCTSAMLADPVNSLTGAYQDEVKDLVLPGTGIPFTFTRSYTSAD